jgi:hypothetical protein
MSVRDRASTGRSSSLRTPLGQRIRLHCFHTSAADASARVLGKRRNGKFTQEPHVSMLKERNVRTGFSEREQIERIVGHPPTVIRPTVLFATSPARIRRSVPVTARGVDFDVRVIPLDGT